jgi:hypothetical protein
MACVGGLSSLWDHNGLSSLPVILLWQGDMDRQKKKGIEHNE